MSRRLFPVLLLVLAGWIAPQAAAQASNPVYLQYDGYVKNKDGSFTLSFGYFNLNHVEVKLGPGPENSFSPGPADRNQPAVFLRGRHRFVCSMVVPPNFDGKLQWTVKFGGVTSTTTGKLLDPLYELELNSERRVLSGLNLATAPKGVCVNRAPAVQIINPNADFNAGADTLAATAFTTRLNQELSLNGEVEDDALPRNAKITIEWKKISGPGTVTFSDPGSATTRVRFSEVGVYEVELSAGDSEQTNSARVKVTVVAAN